MSLHQIITNIKSFLIIVFIFFLILNSFLLGQLTVKTDKSRHSIIFLEREESEEIGSKEHPDTDLLTISGKEKLILASKNGTKYYYTWCSGASRIKEENKVWFNSREEAINRGYTKAANCQGE